jgi:hypothetical protein
MLEGTRCSERAWHASTSSTWLDWMYFCRHSAALFPWHSLSPRVQSDVCVFPSARTAASSEPRDTKYLVMKLPPLLPPARKTRLDG